MKPRLFTLAALLAVAAVLSVSAAEPQDRPRADFAAQSPYKVNRIIDGDTVVLLIDGKETTVRLIGVDTPETVHPTKPVERYGKEASRFLKNLLKGEDVYLEYEPGPSKTDRYGRLLAYLYRASDGLFVNLEIVRQGYGHAYTQYPFKYMDLFRKYEGKAREVGKGLWATPEQTAATETGAAPIAASPRASVREPGASDTQEVTVYITQTGRKYHREDCRYLGKSKIPILLKQAKARGYEPCKVCKPPR